MLLKKFNKHCIKPFFTCSGGYDTVRSHELRIGTKNYNARPYTPSPNCKTYSKEEGLQKNRYRKIVYTLSCDYCILCTQINIFFL